MWAEGHCIDIAHEQNLLIVYDTDAENKSAKYEHLGMSLAKIRDLGNGVFTYDLYRSAGKSPSP